MGIARLAAENSGQFRRVLGLAAVFLVVFLWSAYRPWHPGDWWLENVMTAVGLGILFFIYHRVLFSPAAWYLSFLFLCLHEIGAHFTYAEVPYDQVWRAATGWSLDEAVGATRNHFDRWVHFLYGAMLFVPWREVFQRLAGTRGFWSFAWPLVFIVATSTLYELIEWAAAVVFGGELGAAYLGTQGDAWDAQKDMALAALGGLLAMMASMLSAWRRDPRAFVLDWRESLRIHRSD